MPVTVKLRHPSRFHAQGRVQVNTADGSPFYVFDRPDAYEFTLPKGTFSLSGGTLIGKHVAKRAPRLSTLRFKLPKRVRVTFAPNPDKARISLPTGEIVVDPSLCKLPSYCLTYVLFHEIGHYFHREEEACDRFAAEEMERRGFNPSQIHQAAELTLGSGYRRTCNLQTAKRLDNGRQQPR